MATLTVMTSTSPLHSLLCTSMPPGRTSHSISPLPPPPRMPPASLPLSLLLLQLLLDLLILEELLLKSLLGLGHLSFIMVARMALLLFLAVGVEAVELVVAVGTGLCCVYIGEAS